MNYVLSKKSKLEHTLIYKFQFSVWFWDFPDNIIFFNDRFLSLEPSKPRIFSINGENRGSKNELVFFTNGKWAQL